MTSPVVLFLCASALTLVSVGAGAFFTLWAVYVLRSGVSPLPNLPAMRLFGRRKHDDGEENGQTERPRATPRVGP